MTKRKPAAGTKRKMAPAASLRDVRPAFGRLRIAPPPVSRRELIGGGIGIFATGIGIGALLGRLGNPPAPEPPIVAPPQHVAAQLPMPFMEEEPLPEDVYIPPPAAAAEGQPPVVLSEPSAFRHPRPEAAPAPAAPAPALRAPPQPQPRVASGATWLRNARPFIEAGGLPVMAIVIDDLGLDPGRTRQAIALDGNVTLAFMTYADRLPQWREAAHEARHELLVHVPMQPLSASVDPGPNALTTSLSQAQITQRLRWGLERMDGYVGANNHMGSRFTEDAAGMRVVMDELKARGLLFLDSRTTARSTCADAAAGVGLPFLQRNVFLDNETNVDAVRQQLAALEGVARKHGSAIGIGHPHDATLTVLAQYLPTAASRGIAVLPLTSVMRHAMARS